jgi:hypothetical protein
VRCSEKKNNQRKDRYSGLLQRWDKPSCY